MSGFVARNELKVFTFIIIIKVFIFLLFVCCLNCFVLFLCLKHLMKSEYSAGENVEVRTQVEDFGDIWVSAIAIMENEDGTLLLVKHKSLSGGEEDEWTKRNVPYSEVRPPPPPFDLRPFGLMERVDALLGSGWCPSVVSMVLTGDRYTLLVGTNKEGKDFVQSQLRPSMEWKGGAWLTKEKVLVSCYLIF